MSACPTENAVIDALGGEDKAVARVELEQHIAQCAPCRRLVEVMTRTSVAATGQGQPPAAGPDSGHHAPGSIVGRYRIERVIGEGGMGVVYAARDPELDRAVAIKLIRPGLGSTSEMVEQRLVRESRAMAQLAHPNVLAVHDVGRTDGQIFIAMELAAGGTLSAWLSAEPRGWREIVARFSLAGRGLQAAHRTGLVHRDFKSENVLLTADGGVRVADFGLVGSDAAVPTSPAEERAATQAQGPGEDPANRAAHDVPAEALPLTRTGARLGTPLYMAPEQHEGKKVGPAADQYAFAVALYEALYREHPFPATTYAELVRAVQRGVPRDPPDTSDVPPALREVLLRALRVDPEERWPSMATLLDALDRGVARAAEVGEPDSLELRTRVAALRSRLDQARALAEAGRYSDALPLVRAVSEEAATLAYAPLRAEALFRQGVVEGDSGDLRAAHKTLTDAAVEAARARDDALAARVWTELLILVGHREGRSAEAQFLLPAAEAALARCGNDPGVRSRFLSTLAVVLADNGRYAESHESLARAAALCEEAFGPFDLQLATVHNNLGKVHTARGDYEAARVEHERALAIWTHVLDPDHPQHAWSLHNRGELAYEQGDYGQAEALLTQAIAIRERTLRPGHPFLALSLHHLGAVRLGQGRADDARQLHERAVSLRLEALGAEHPDVAESLNGLGAALVALGRADDARAHHERALAIVERALGADHIRVARCANHLGEALSALGLHDLARGQHERALAIAERVLGPGHPQVARSLAGLARAALGLGRPSDAAIAARRARHIADQRGMGHAVQEEIRALLVQAQAALSAADLRS